MYKFIKVTGSSLSPLFLSGDYVLIRTVPKPERGLKKGDTVVVSHPILGRIIKQIKSIQPSQRILWLEGIHPASTSTEKIGPVSFPDILGKVVLHIKSPR